MKINTFWIASVVLGLLSSCSNNSSSGPTASTTDASTSAASTSANYDSVRGSGKFKHIDLQPTPQPTLVAAGKSVYELKCSACHKLTGEKLVGPGWLGVTNRHTPEWIMNFATNTDEMIDKDPKAQAMLQVCMVRMPNQHLSDDDARNILEFMRNNDKDK
ncbi:MAG TPA: cytochrome c [Puia sp.]|uniref:c-type cytochrome n=1 Tax=Puia sp. TaxID=2045100 RepID=UPI002CD49D7C|nr:cytochrome c [Puia sp.]HVU94186.1 cytochrome c [Puia sp.]